MIKQFGRVNWLGKKFKIVSAMAIFLKQIPNAGLAGKKYDPALWKHRTHLNRDIYAVHVRHDDVTQENPRAALPRLFNRGLTVIGNGYLKAMLGEDHLERIGDVRFVVGNENLRLISSIVGHVDSRVDSAVQKLYANIRI